MADFKLTVHPRYVDDGMYVGLTNKANFEAEDLTPEEMANLPNPDKIWPGFAHLV